MATASPNPRNEAHASPITLLALLQIGLNYILAPITRRLTFAWDSQYWEKVNAREREHELNYRSSGSGGYTPLKNKHGNAA